MSFLMPYREGKEHEILIKMTIFACVLSIAHCQVEKPFSKLGQEAL
jgi:hypothetical protein